jgi:16S rRNA A1518/A1519 N6-dimethyltransferase RsmA/KsgA/DIM1 with predicted DNA glycosylase/AP lyase activity
MSCAPYVPTDMLTVKKMLQLAKVGPGDIVYDLGCGDGRILFTAVTEFNATKAVGYELNKSLYKKTLHKIQQQNQQEKIKIFNDNFFNANIADASVITLYLTTNANTRLAPKLLSEAQEGTRIVSHDFDIHNFRLVQQETFGESFWHKHSLYLYIISSELIQPRNEREKRFNKLRHFLRLAS